MAGASPAPLPARDNSSLDAWFAQADTVLSDHEADQAWWKEYTPPTTDGEHTQ